MASQLDVNVDVKVDGVENLDRAAGGIDNVEQHATRFGSVAQGAVIGVSSAFAGFAIGLAKIGLDNVIDQIGRSIELASSKAEAASKAQTIFGDSYSLISEKATSAAHDVGLSSGAYLEAAGNIGNLITNLGYSGDAAADTSVDVVQLAADLGSFNNLPTERALEAIESAFRGESEPISAFGVKLNEATIKAKALELGLYDGKGAIDANAKATATWAIILEQTSKAQGDYAKTADGLANSQKTAAATVDDALTRLGELLLPLAAKIVPALGDAVADLVDWISQVVDQFSTWASDNQGLLDGIGTLVGLIWDLNKKYLSALFDVVGKVVSAIADWIEQNQWLIDGITTLLNGALGLLIEGLKLLAGAIDLVGDGFGWITGREATATEGMERLGSSTLDAADAADATGEGWERLGATVTTAAERSGDGWAAIAKIADDSATSTAESFAEMGQDVDESIANMARAALETFQANEQWLTIGQTIPENIAAGMSDGTEVLDAADRLVQLLKDGLSPAEEAAKLEGQKYTKAVAAGMQSEIPGAKDAARQTAIAAISVIEDAADGTPDTKGLEAIGKYYDALLAGGMDDRAIAVALAAAGVAGDVIQRLTGYYPDFDASGKAYDVHLASGIDAASGKVDTAVDDATDPLHDQPVATWGANLGDAWVAAFAKNVRGGESIINAAIKKATAATKGDSPPKVGPLREIDRWGYNIGGAWIGGMVDGIAAGAGMLNGALGRVLTADGSAGAAGAFQLGQAAPVTVNVYAGVGDPVAIGREVSEALRAYQRASGSEA